LKAEKNTVIGRKYELSAIILFVLETPFLGHVTIQKSVMGVVAKHHITQLSQPPLQPRFGSLRLLAFPKSKIAFES